MLGCGGLPRGHTSKHRGVDIAWCLRLGDLRQRRKGEGGGRALSLGSGCMVSLKVGALAGVTRWAGPGGGAGCLLMAGCL